MTKRSQIIDYLGLIFLSAIWGSSFLFIKLSVTTIEPYLLTFLRLFIASIILSIFLKVMTGEKIFNKDSIYKLIFIAIFGNFIPFNLISWGETYVDSVVASTLIGTMPLFTCLISHFSDKGERVNLTVFLGLLVGFAGIFVLFETKVTDLFDKENFVNSVILFSALCYALSANCVKGVLKMSSLKVATSSTIYATILSFLTLPIIHFSQHKSVLIDLNSVTMQSIFSCIFLGVFCTAFAIIIFFYLIRKNSAVFASQSNFFIPCFGLFWSYLFLEESITGSLILSLGLIVFSLFVVHKGRNRLYGQ